MIKTLSALLQKLPLKITSTHRCHSFKIIDSIPDGNYYKLTIECIRNSTFKRLRTNEIVLNHRHSIKFIAISHCVINDLEKLEKFLRIFKNLTKLNFFNCHFSMRSRSLGIRHEKLKFIETKLCNVEKFVFINR